MRNKRNTRPQPGPPGLAARHAALDLLIQVAGEGRLLAELLPQALTTLPAQDRARAQRLATETLRWMDRADRMLGPHLRRRPPLAGLMILRLGAVELFVDAAAPHGVVDAAVTLAKSDPKTAPLAGLINAVLRKLAQQGVAAWRALPEPRLPKWLRAPLIAAYGKAGVAAIEAAHARGAPRDLTPKDGDAAGLAQRLGGRALATGSVRLDMPGQVTAMPGYAQGVWWVQDAAAALPARILAPAPGARVLDLCAAPGGKTLQLAAMGARVTALDVSAARLARLAKNLARTGLSADTVVADALTWRPEAPFDAILLDAPCSATGTIRRHPDLPHAKDGAGFAALFDLQAALIDRAAGWLAPGGRLVYCTCSLLPDEGEVQAQAARARHPDLVPDPAALDRPGIAPEWIGAEGLRTRPDQWPEIGGLDGFFVAAFRKRLAPGT